MHARVISILKQGSHHPIGLLASWLRLVNYVKNPINQDPKWSMWARADARRAVCVPTRIWYILAFGPPQELWRKEANRLYFPRRDQSHLYRLDRWPPLQFNDPKLPMRNPLVRNIVRYLRWPRVYPCRLKRKPRTAEASSPVEAIARWWPYRLNEPYSALISRVPFECPDWGFTWYFLSCYVNVRVYNTKSGHRPHSPLSARRLHLRVW